MNNSRENCDLARELLASTASHVSAHIDNKKNKLAYMRAATRCQLLALECESGNDLNLVKQKLLTLRYNLSKHFKRRWISREYDYYELAVQHAIDVVDSILIRFVNGYSSRDELLHLNLLEGHYDEYQVCACLSRFGRK